MIGVKYKFILEDGRGMHLVTVPILYELHHYEIMLVDVRDQGRLMEIWDVKDKMHLRVDVDYPLF